MSLAKLYRWKDGARFSKLDPQEVGEELDEIAAENEGALDPEDVVAKARPKKSLLHPVIFELNEKQAAHQHRIDKARHLIRSVTVVYREATEEEEEATTRAYEVVHRGTKRYFGVFSIMASPDQRDLLVRTALRELHGWRKRYAGISELAAIHDALEKEAPAAE